jgi:hypothetical protein
MEVKLPKKVWLTNKKLLQTDVSITDKCIESCYF